MSAIEWNETLSLGIPTIDRQHRMLIDSINTLDAAIQRGAGQATLAQVLKSLGTYVAVHFIFEESLLRVSRYPQLNDHHDEHEHFRRTLDNFGQRFARGDTSVASDVHTFLKNWLTTHIQVEDRAYAPCVQAHQRSQQRA